MVVDSNYEVRFHTNAIYLLISGYSIYLAHYITVEPPKG